MRTLLAAVVQVVFGTDQALRVSGVQRGRLGDHGETQLGRFVLRLIRHAADPRECGTIGDSGCPPIARPLP